MRAVPLSTHREARMRTNAIALPLTLVVIMMVVGCGAPTGAGRPAPGTDSGTGSARPQGSAPQAVLAIALRAELPSLAARPLVPFSMALYPPLYLFNAM